MKLVVSLLLLWVTAADPRVIKGNEIPMLSSQMKQKFARSSPFHETQNIDIGTRENCVQDYSPCTCRADPNIYVTCTKVPVEIVRDVFQRVNDSEIEYLGMYFLPSDDTVIFSLPADLLGDTSVTGSIYISGYSFSYANLVIDPLAFHASQNSLTLFWSDYCDFGLQKDFSFLTSFSKLEEFWISNSNNIFAFQHLPPLPSLRDLELHSCTGLINFPDLSPDARLNLLHVAYCSLNDETADEIVAKLIDTSAESLLDLSLPDNSLTRIPNQLGSPFAFPKLQRLYLEYNAIKTIENGTFQGNLTKSSLGSVDLSYNKLVVFEEGVFKELLENIVTYDGVLRVLQNPFACGCDITWLIQYNRNLLPFVYGYCASDSPFPSVSFQDLDPDSFSNCPN